MGTVRAEPEEEDEETRGQEDEFLRSHSSRILQDREEEHSIVLSEQGGKDLGAGKLHDLKEENFVLQSDALNEKYKLVARPRFLFGFDFKD